MVKPRRTILIVAYACEPDETSEPGVGWNFSKEISKSCNTIVLTRENNRTAIESGKENESNFIYYDLPKWMVALKKRIPLGTQWYYALWQWGAYCYAKRYMTEIEKTVDVVHHLNFAMTWLAPPAYLIDEPFVWGPVGGGDFIPINFFKVLTFKSKLQESFYFLLNQVGRISIFSFLTKRKSEAILFRTESALKNFPIKKDKLLQMMSETASVSTVFATKKAVQEIKALCVGRLFYWKGFLYAVKGFHYYLEKGGVGTLEILGDGPERKRIEEYVSLHKLEKNIFIRGFVDNHAVKKKMEEASVLLHPSFRDGGSWSIMEAMTLGMPVVCLNTSGPKDMVTKDCGIMIDLISPERMVTDIGLAMLRLLEYREDYETMSENASNRIKTEYNWNRRGEQIVKVYNDILNDTE